MAKTSKPAPAESSDSETEVTRHVKRKSAAEIRHIKKERQRVAREGSEETRTAAHQYLQQWSSDRASWKFNKARQLWVIRHLYLETQVPADIFELAIQYLDGSGDVLRKSLVADARLVAEPMSAITPELQAMRAKSLGLMPSHVTKAEANAKRTKSKDKTAAPAAAAAKEGEKTETADNDAEGAVSEGTMKRALRIIEILAAVKPVEPVAKKETKTKRKQAESSDESSDDSSSDEDEKEKKKKRKTEKKEKKSDKKEKKSKDKSDKKSDKKDKKSKS
ncbi:hypothetical protein FBU31_004848, partial [Coemansia sp. 'formosensis']